MQTKIGITRIFGRENTGDSGFLLYYYIQCHLQNKCEPIVVITGRDRIHLLEVFAGLQQQSAPPEGSHPFIASCAAFLEVAVGATDQLLSVTAEKAPF